VLVEIVRRFTSLEQRRLFVQGVDSRMKTLLGGKTTTVLPEMKKEGGTEWFWLRMLLRRLWVWDGRSWALEDGDDFY